jgi:hypothetical protein
MGAENVIVFGEHGKGKERKRNIQRERESCTKRVRKYAKAETKKTER